ncbi:hypothetical protein BJY52DRAFT_1421836 [Lactarius psammicola]|nr:hypothetical protein BJY52DRAFT_1421836 [Lactarius psammicola]
MGKSGSGKSTLIKAVFKVDMTVEPMDTHGNVDINAEFHPEDNRYLVIHEYSGLESQARDSQNLQTIRDFISYRTDASCSPSESLHAVWICVPASEAAVGRLGEGVEEILGMRTVPVILVFTKFDMIVPEVRGDMQQHRHARARALAMCKDSCRRLSNKDPRDVPAEIVSVKPRYTDLIEKLVATTDRSIMGPHSPSVGFGVQGGKPQVCDVPLACKSTILGALMKKTRDMGDKKDDDEESREDSFKHKQGDKEAEQSGRGSNAADYDLASGSSQVDSLRDCPLYCASLYTWLHGVYIMEYSGNW